MKDKKYLVHKIEIKMHQHGPVKIICENFSWDWLYQI